MLLPRIAFADCELGGFRIPKDTIVNVGTLQIHYRSDYWGDDAADFRPERWLQPTHPSCPVHAYSPFGHLQRTCPWGGFVERMFVFAHAALAQDRRFEFSPETSLETKSFGLGLKETVPATVTARPREVS